MISALRHELFLRKNEITEPVDTIYFGGGTPSVLSNNEINLLIDEIYQLFSVAEKL